MDITTGDGTKRCPDCRETKPLHEFNRSRKSRDGRWHYCRLCWRVRLRGYYRKRREAIGLPRRREVPEGQKYCPDCKTVKVEADFGRNKAARDGLNSYCKACRSERNKRAYRKKAYDMTPEEAAELIASQGGKCGICLVRVAKHVDHDHETGRVRGALCFSCNAALGNLKDSPALLRRAAAYLEGGTSPLREAESGVFVLPRMVEPPTWLGRVTARVK
jgi:hypothetical protein